MFSRKHLLAAGLVGVVVGWVIGHLIQTGPDQDRRIQSLEATIRQLQTSPTEAASKDVQPPALQSPESPTRAGKSHTVPDGEKTGGARVAADTPTGSLRILKELENGSGADPRSSVEKLQELLSGSPTNEEIAIASRFIFDHAGNRENLPDYALQSLYASQHDAELRRVIAQVLSQRGNNALLNNQIAETQAKLMSDRPRDRQAALAQLGKMHSTKAVDAIAPFLQDPDTTVRLEALFALRDTGNQQHVHLVEPMLNDPDPSVSTLAADVLGSLKNLSASARTNYSRSDIEAELPPIANP